MKLRKWKFRLLPDSKVYLICEIIYTEHHEELLLCDVLTCYSLPAVMAEISYFGSG